MKSVNKYAPKKSGASKFSKKSRYLQVDWVEYRNKFLRHNRDCYCCGQPARVVDHFVAFKGNEELFRKQDNFVPMCKSCHSTVTQLYDKQAVPDTAGKLAWINRKRDETGTTTRIVLVPWSVSPAN